MKKLWIKNEGFRVLIISVLVFFLFFGIAIIFIELNQMNPKTYIIGDV